MIYKIIVRIDKTCEMARVSTYQDSAYIAALSTEGNYCDFYNGCYGMYHLPSFNGVESFVVAVKAWLAARSHTVESVTYDCEWRYND